VEQFKTRGAAGCNKVPGHSKDLALKRSRIGVRDDQVVVREIFHVPVNKSFTALIQTKNTSMVPPPKTISTPLSHPGLDPGSPKAGQRHDAQATRSREISKVGE